MAVRLCEFESHPPYNLGAIAQLVEQRTENPCVPGSIPGGTTIILVSWMSGLVTGLQNQLQRFESATDLRK